MSPTPPLLVYDGSCGLCVRAVGRLVRARIADPDACRPLQGFEGARRARLFAAGIRNELLVEQPDGKLLSGIDGLRVLFAQAGRRRTAALLGFAPVRALATFAYRLVATNRRVLAPVDGAQRVACDCDPEPRAGYRVAFVLLCLALACGGAALVGALLGAWSGTGAARAALLGLAFPALLAVPPLLLGVPRLPRARRGEGAAHVALQTAQSVRAGAFVAGGVLVAAAVVLGGLFLLAVTLAWAPGLRIFAALYPVVWPTIVVVGGLSAVHGFVRGLVRRRRTLGGDT